MSITSIVGKSRSLSIAVDSNQSTNNGSRYKSITRFLVIIDFDRFSMLQFDFDRFQLTSIENKTMYGGETRLQLLNTENL